MDGHSKVNIDIWGACNPKKDPLYQLVTPAILRYCEEWWRLAAPEQRNGRLLEPKTMVDAFKAAQRAMARGRSSTGPAYNMLQMMEWAGWRVKSAFVFVDGQGMEWHLGRHAPADLKGILERDILANVEERATHRVWNILQTMGYPADQAQKYKPWWAEMRKYSQSKAPPLHRNLILRAFSDNMITEDKWRRWGYNTDGICKCCARKADTTWHRAFECLKVQQRKQREEAEGKKTWTWPKWKTEATSPEAMQSLLIPADLEIDVPPAQDEVHAYIDGEEVPVESFSLVPGVPAASDGSAVNSKWPTIARAAWSVVQHAHGVWYVLMGTVGPRWKQLAVTAEYEAAIRAARAGATRSLAIDCNAVLKPAMRGVQQRCDYRRRHATWWRAIGRGATSGWRKVQAHIEVPEHPCTEEEVDVWLNDKADSKAKEALKWHYMPDSTQELFKKGAERAQAFLKEVSANLAEHPRPKDAHVEYARLPGGGRKLKAKVRQPHQWFWTSRSTWRCHKCWREKLHASSAQDYEPCGDVRGTMAKLALNGHSHALTAALIAEGPAMLIFCRRCGGMAETKARWLAESRCRKPTAQTRRTLRRLEAGFHPSRCEAIGSLWDLTGGVGTQHCHEGWQAALSEGELAEEAGGQAATCTEIGVEDACQQGIFESNTSLDVA